MLTRIWKNPTLSASPKLRFFIPDSTSDAITGSSGGRPRFSAWPAIHAASCSCGASLPGYASGAAAATAERSTGAPAGWLANCSRLRRARFFVDRRQEGLRVARIGRAVGRRGHGPGLDRRQERVGLRRVERRLDRHDGRLHGHGGHGRHPGGNGAPPARARRDAAAAGAGATSLNATDRWS